MTRPPPSRSERRVARNIAWLLGQHLVVATVSIAIASALARYFGPKDFGTFEYAFAYVGVFSLFSNFGFSAVTIRTVAQDPDRIPQILSSVLTLRVVIALLLLLPLWLITESVHDQRHVVLAVIVAALALPVDVASSAIRDVCQGVERFSIEAISGVIRRVATAVGAVLVIWLGGDVIDVVAVYVAGAFIGAIVPFWVASRERWLRPPSWKNQEVVKLIRQALPFGAIAMLEILMWDVNLLLLGGISGLAAVGLFAVAAKVVNPFSIIPDALSSSLTPTVARGWHNKDPETEPLIRRSIYALMSIGLPISIGGFLCAPPLVEGLFGSEFGPAADVLRVILIALPLDFISTPAYYVLGAIHQQDRSLRVSVVGAVTNVILAIILIPKFGVIGCAVAAAAASVVCCVGSLSALASHFRFWSSGPAYFRLLLANSIMALFVVLSLPYGVLVAIPVGVLVYTVAASALKVVDWRAIKALAASN
jgi:O-antigen/teichoic acid export membrane protein